MKGSEWMKWAKGKTNGELSEVMDALDKIEAQKKRLDSVDKTISREFDHLGYIRDLAEFVRDEQNTRIKEVVSKGRSITEVERMPHTDHKVKAKFYNSSGCLISKDDGTPDLATITCSGVLEAGDKLEIVEVLE